VRRNVTGIAVHPKVYLPTAAGPHQYHAFYDLALLFLDRPVNIPPAPIGLPTDGDFGEGLATAMGWGHVNYDHAHPQRTPYLKAADFALYNDDQCSYYFDDATTQHYYPAIHLCVGDAPGGYLDCITHGDSGGPLMVLEGGQWKLIGITSFYPHGDYACNGAGPPFGFAWVAGPTLRSWPLTVANPGDSGVGGGGALDLSMSRREVRGYIRAMIHENTNGKIRRLRARCHRLSYRSMRCRLRWRIKRRVYSGKARFWHYAQNGEPYWTYSFNGKRRRNGHSRYKRLRW
jgi:hypothetical protein